MPLKRTHTYMVRVTVTDDAPKAVTEDRIVKVLSAMRGVVKVAKMRFRGDMWIPVEEERHEPRN